jgi:hypothetical protein
MNKFLLILLALFMTAGVPLVHAGDDVKKPAEEEPECD